MPTLEFRENKTLKLTNVLSRKVPIEELFSPQKQVVMLANWIKAKEYDRDYKEYSEKVIVLQAEQAKLKEQNFEVQLTRQ